MPTPEEAKKEIQARIKMVRGSKKQTNLSMDSICTSMRRGRNVYLVFDSNAERLKYQKRILQLVSDSLNKEPLGGLPLGSLSGERVFQWDNGAEIAFSTSIPGDLDGNLPMERKPANTDIGRPEIPDSWNTTKK